MTPKAGRTGRHARGTTMSVWLGLALRAAPRSPAHAPRDTPRPAARRSGTPRAAAATRDDDALEALDSSPSSRSVPASAPRCPARRRSTARPGRRRRSRGRDPHRRDQAAALPPIELLAAPRGRPGRSSRQPIDRQDREPGLVRGRPDLGAGHVQVFGQDTDPVGEPVDRCSASRRSRAEHRGARSGRASTASCSSDAELSPPKRGSSVSRSSGPALARPAAGLASSASPPRGRHPGSRRRAASGRRAAARRSASARVAERKTAKLPSRLRRRSDGLLRA